MYKTTFAMTALTCGLWPVWAATETVGTGSGALNVVSGTAGILDELKWKARLVVVLGTPEKVNAQISIFQKQASELRDRDVVILTEGQGVAELGGETDDLAVLLIGKDGSVKEVYDRVIDPADIMAVIDSMPMRQREQSAKGD